jgi:hypothetical protein
LLLKYEHSIYRAWSEGKGDAMPSLNSLLRTQLRNKGVYYGPDGNLHYVVDGARMSGDMNTSLGNVIIMCTLMYSYLEHKGLLRKVELLNDGDDCVIIMDVKDLKWFKSGLEDWFLESGITMKYDGIYRTLEEVEFCQSRPLAINGGHMMCPRPTKRLYSDLISTKQLSGRKVYTNQVGAIAGCGLAYSSGVPVFQSFYKWLGRGATPWIPKVGDQYFRFRQELIEGMQIKESPISWETRISFYFCFNITPKQQMIMEQYYDKLPDPLYSKPIDNPARTLRSLQRLIPPEQKD